jgi:hypothetical protein
MASTRHATIRYMDAAARKRYLQYLYRLPSFSSPLLILLKAYKQYTGIQAAYV